MTWSNLRFSVQRSFVAMATNVPSCLLIQFLEQLMKFVAILLCLNMDYLRMDGKQYAS